MSDNWDEYANYPEFQSMARDNVHNIDEARRPRPSKTPEALPAWSIGADFLDDIATLPRRDWLIPRTLLRSYVAALFSPGGVGKSLFQLTHSVSVAAGKDLLDLGETQRGNVLVINNEDDADELRRRLAAIMLHYGVTPDQLDGRLHCHSGYSSPLMIAHRMQDGTIVPAPDWERLAEFIQTHQIDAVMLDPFISTHSASENDNGEIDAVISQYKRLAAEHKIAVSLAHHVRKIGGDSEAHAGDADAGRGASSLKDASRAVSTLARMSSKTAEKLHIDDHERGRYVRLDTGKLNFDVHDAAAQWFYMASVELPNGEWVGVPERRDLQSKFDQAAAQDQQARWTPTSVAEAVHSVWPNSQADRLPWSQVRERFCSRHDVGERMARRAVEHLPLHETDAVSVQIRGEFWLYWRHRGEGKTAPTYLCRKAR